MSLDLRPAMTLFLTLLTRTRGGRARIIQTPLIQCIVHITRASLFLAAVVKIITDPPAIYSALL